MGTKDRLKSKLPGFVVRLYSSGLSVLSFLKAFGRPKIFCISFQRCGTKSVGKFFKDHGYTVAGHGLSRSSDWSMLWFKCNYDAIFTSRGFRSHQVFQDAPWWCGDFYKLLYYRFPNSRFVLLERDKDKWFDSMKTHSAGRTLGNTHIHASLYGREKEFFEANRDELYYEKAPHNMLSLDEQERNHYTDIYSSKLREMKTFFQNHDASRLFVGQLEDPLVWQKLGAFMGIKVATGYVAHIHQTNK